MNINEEIPLSTPIEDVSFTVFDTETTGFQVTGVDRLIEIGAVHVKGLEVKEQDIFQTYVNPDRDLPPFITDLTGITENTISKAPHSLDAISSFFSFMENHNSNCMVGHYISFDMLVLKSELKRNKLHLKKQPTIDTLDVINFIAPTYDTQIRDLERYAMAFGTRIYGRHNALGDALTTAFLFVELLSQSISRGSKTWGDLLKSTDNETRQTY
nr:3'-5' exonuclease [Bacillus sp. HMF5848]